MKPLPLHKINSSDLKELEAIAYSYRVNDALYHIRKARSVFSAFRSNEIKDTSRQLLITKKPQKNILSSTGGTNGILEVKANKTKQFSF